MSKKLITAALALVALAAFALPASSSATTLTEPTGTALTGTPNLTGTLVGASIMWNTAHTVKLLECTTATMTGTLTSNAPEPKGNITSASFGGTGATVAGAEEPECTGEIGSSTVDTNIGNGVPWCLTLTSNTTFSLRGNKCSEASRSITFVLTSTVAGTCKYNRTAAVTGSIKNDLSGTQDALASITAGAASEWVKEEGGFLCPSAGQLEMSFTLETDEKETKPIYVS